MKYAFAYSTISKIVCCSFNEDSSIIKRQFQTHFLCIFFTFHNVKFTWKHEFFKVISRQLNDWLLHQSSKQKRKINLFFSNSNCLSLELWTFNCSFYICASQLCHEERRNGFNEFKNVWKSKSSAKQYSCHFYSFDISKGIPSTLIELNWIKCHSEYFVENYSIHFR